MSANPVETRPNFVAELRYPDGRMVINNGNHRVAVLARAGHTEVPAVVQQVVGSIHQMGIGVEGNFNERLDHIVPVARGRKRRSL